MQFIAKLSTTIFLQLAAMAFSTTTVFAAIPSTASEALSSRQLQFQQADELAQSGREAMTYIVAAHQLLVEQHSEEAIKYLEQSKDLLAKLKTEIANSSGNISDLLSIYSHVEIKDGVEVTDQIKQQLRNTRLNTINADHKEVIAALENVNIELQYRFVDLPVTATLEKVESALTSISSKNTQEAVKTLADAIANLIHESTVINAMNENIAG